MMIKYVVKEKQAKFACFFTFMIKTIKSRLIKKHPAN